MNGLSGPDWAVPRCLDAGLLGEAWISQHGRKDR
jgi:hypothetical protein